MGVPSPISSAQLGGRRRALDDSNALEGRLPMELEQARQVGPERREELTDGLELFGRIENVFDRTYEQVLGFGAVGRTFTGGIRARI